MTFMSETEPGMWVERKVGCICENNDSPEHL